MIKISSFAKAKSNSNGNNNASSGGVVVPTVIMKKTPNVRIWGQWHDHTGDVNGDMTVEGKIDVTGDITTQSSVIGKKGDFVDIVSETLKTTDIQATNIVSDNGFINNISASSINTDSIDAKYGRYDELLVENLTGENGTFHNLTVTGKAHFFELVIDKITASGGAVIFSPADGFEVEKVIWLVNSSTDYLNIPATFLLPTNYHLIDYNNLNYTRAIIDVGGNKSNAFVVRPYNTTLDMDWYYFWETGELMRQDKIVELKYPDLYGEYKVIESSNPKMGEGVYNYKYEIVEEDTNEYLYNLSYPDGYALIDYKKLKISVCGHDIDGNRVEVDDTIKYATKVWVNEKEQFWFYEEDNLVTDLSTLYTKYNNLWQSYTRTYTPSIATYPIAKSSFTLNPYLLFLAENEQGRAIRNEWQVNDQAICRNFNEAKVGSSQNVKNKYYWGLVIETDYIDTNLGMQFDQIYIDKDGNLIGDYLAEEQFHIYHAIALDASDYDGVLDCEPGDAIAMLGNRTDKDRQKAIYISSYTSLDPSLEAPLFAQYEGINTYSLDGKKTTWFAANGNKIQGKLVVESGKSVEDLISDSEDRTDKELQDLIDKYNKWLNNVEDDLADSYLKALPTTTYITKTYNGWKQAIGTTVTFETITYKNDSTQKFEVLGTNQIFPDLKANDKVAVEVRLTQDYNDSTMPNKATVLGTVTKPPIGMMQMGSNKTTFRTTVRIEYIIDADLSQVWLGMSQLEVEQDNIKMTVTNLGNDLTDKINQGIASLEIRAGQIESKVDNLQGDVSSITQQADNIQLQVNELAIKIDGQKGKIILDGDTEVNGVVNINKDGTGLKLSGSNGETFSIGSNDIGTFDNFENSTAIDYWYSQNKATVSFSNDGYGQYGVTKTETVEVVGDEIIKLAKGKQISISNVAIHRDEDDGAGSKVEGNVTVMLVNPNTGIALDEGQRSCNVVEGSPEQGGFSYQDKYSSIVRWPPLMTGDKPDILSFTAPSDIEFKIKLRYNISGKTPQNANAGSGSQLNLQKFANTAKYSSMVAYSISVDAFGKLTYNGFGFNFGSGKIAFIGNDQMTFKINPFCGWRLTSNEGFQRLVPEEFYIQHGGVEPFDKPLTGGSFGLVRPKNGGKWIGITDSIVRAISFLGSYDSDWQQLCLLDEVIHINSLPSSKNIVLVLPKPNNSCGKKFYIKNNVRADNATGHVYVGVFGGYLYTTLSNIIRDPANNKYCDTSKSFKFNDGEAKTLNGLYTIDRLSIMMVCDGDYWNVYYCG